MKRPPKARGLQGKWNTKLPLVRKFSRKLIKSGERSKSPSIVKNFEGVLSMVLAVSGKCMSATVRMTQVQI